MSDENAFDLLIKQFPGNVEMSPRDTEILEDEVRKLLKEDIRSLDAIRRLCKSSETFTNSCGNLYTYLMDQKICNVCDGKLFHCPKKTQGYQKILQYDNIRDEIKCSVGECTYLHSLLSILDRIYPSSIATMDTYRCFISIHQQYSKLQNRQGMCDTGRLIFKDTLNLVHSLNDGKYHAGYCIHSINSENLSKKILKAICFIFAKSGYSCSYVDLNNTLRCFYDKDWRTQESAEQTMRWINDVPVLFLEDIQNIPYLSNDILMKYLYPLIRRRHEKNKLTFASINSSLGIEKVIGSKFRSTDVYQEVRELLPDIMETYNIKDFDLE
jgi:hypothetical protein